MPAETRFRRRDEALERVKKENAAPVTPERRASQTPRLRDAFMHVLGTYGRACPSQRLRRPGDWSGADFSLFPQDQN